MLDDSLPGKQVRSLARCPQGQGAQRHDGQQCDQVGRADEQVGVLQTVDLAEQATGADAGNRGELRDALGNPQHVALL